MVTVSDAVKDRLSNLLCQTDRQILEVLLLLEIVQLWVGSGYEMKFFVGSGWVGSLELWVRSGRVGSGREIWTHVHLYTELYLKLDTYVSWLCIIVILLLANGDPTDSLSTITRSIQAASNRLVGGKVRILSYGMDTGNFISIAIITFEFECIR